MEEEIGKRRWGDGIDEGWERKRGTDQSFISASNVFTLVTEKGGGRW